MNVVKKLRSRLHYCSRERCLRSYLAVALRCAQKSEPTLRDDMVDFGIPLFANIHLCRICSDRGILVMALFPRLLRTASNGWNYGVVLPASGSFRYRCPGVPGGTVMASLGLITGIVGFVRQVQL